MKLVLDACVALKWVLAEEGADRAKALQSDEMLAPAIWLPEVGQALWKQVNRAELTATEAARLLDFFRRSPVETAEVEPLIAPALDLANRLRHPVYDCLYLALAIRLDIPVVTADRRFYMAAQREIGMGRHVRLL